MFNCLDLYINDKSGLPSLNSMRVELAIDLRNIDWLHEIDWHGIHVFKSALYSLLKFKLL